MADAVPAAPMRRRGGRRRLVLEVRRVMPAWRQALVVGAAVLCGLLISAAILVAAGVPPAELASDFADNLIDPQSLRAVLVQAAPLILVGIAASIAFQARFWNLGLEGQMIFGAIGATAVTLWHLGPEPARLPLMLLASIAGGLFWAAIPLLLKVRLRVNEIIATLLLNYVAAHFLNSLLFGAWKDPADSFPHSAAFAASERLPAIGPFSAALPLALLAVLGLLWLTRFSRFGFYLRFIGANLDMAARLGLRVGTLTFSAVMISSGLAGMAGFVIASGMEGRLTQGFAEGYGFSGVLTAFLARNDPLIAAIVALLLAVLFTTGQTLQILYQIPFAMVQLIQAIVVICVATSDFFVRHRVVVRTVGE